METESAKPRRILLEAGPKLTRERAILFMEKLLGRKATPEDIELARQMLPHLPEK